MNSSFEQIKTAYEVANLTVEQIALDQDLDEAVIKAALMHCSSKYRKACGQEDEEDDRLNFSKVQQSDVTQAIYELAMTTEDEHVKSKLLMYIRDDCKGRKDIVRGLANNTFNVLQINQSIQAAKRLAKETEKKLIEA